jgi:thiol-disulfide isomerase/thioredoxin
MKRRILTVLAAALLAAVVVVGVREAAHGGSPDAGPPPTVAAMQARLAGAPAPLSGLVEHANQVLELSRLEPTLAGLRGHPVVVNNWGSWCPPCQSEVPLLREAALHYGTRVGFLGVLGEDTPGSARRFLAHNPLPYPSFNDHGDKYVGRFGVTAGFPVTAFLDSDGRVIHTHQGPYTDAAALAADIGRYALATPAGRRYTNASSVHSSVAAPR